MTGRRSAALLLLCALVLTLFSGCGKQTDASAASVAVSAAPVPSPTGSWGAEVSTLESAAAENAAQGTHWFSMPYNDTYDWDPFSSLGMENRAVMDLVYEGLFQLNDAFEPENVLCSDYSTSDDGRTYTLTLREGVRFSDGDTMSTGDVVYSLEKAQDSELYAARFADVESISRDGGNVVITLSTPNDRFVTLLDTPIVPDGSGAEPLGTGPFVRSGTESLAVNTSWWQGAATVPFTYVGLKQCTSAEDTRDQFEIDNVHFVYTNPTDSAAASYHAECEIWNSSGTVMQYLAFNFASPFFSSDSIRRAVTHAIDRDTLAESVYHNYAVAATLPVSPASGLYDETLADSYAYNVSEAASLLADDTIFDSSSVSPASGSAEDDVEVNTITSAAPTEGDEADATTTTMATASGTNGILMIVCNGNLSRVSAAKKTAANLNAVGFSVTLNVLEPDDFQVATEEGLFDICYAEVCLKPDFDLRALFAEDSPLNYSNLDSEELSDRLDAAMENSGNYYDLYSYLLSNAYLCPLLFRNNAVFTTRGVFSGLTPSPDNLFYHIAGIQVSQGGDTDEPAVSADPFAAVSAQAETATPSRGQDTSAVEPSASSSEETQTE